MIRCLAIDDEPLALWQIANYIEKVPFLELAASCRSALEARTFLEHETIDAIFCDINMPDLNGMDFVKSLDVPPLIIFTTAYSGYAVDSYRLGAIDYLLKPFGLQEFQRAANRIKERLESRTDGHNPASQQDPDQLFIRTDYRIVSVRISSIRYIEAMSEYLKIWTEGQQKPIITLLSMKKLEEYLPKPEFLRTHRSFIVHMKETPLVDKFRIVFDDVMIPISDNYKEEVQKYFDEHTLV